MRKIDAKAQGGKLMQKVDTEGYMEGKVNKVARLQIKIL